MGSCLSTGHDAMVVLIVGLDGAGKSAVVARLGGEEVRTTTPTAGFAIHHLALSDGAEFKVYDVGGRHDLRGHWRIYYPKAHAIVFVLDAVDRRRLHEAAAELQRLLDDDTLVHVPFLLLANKQDVPGALPAGEVEAMLNLGAIRDRKWNCLDCSAVRGDGVVPGLQWLASHPERRSLGRAARGRGGRSHAAPMQGRVGNLPIVTRGSSESIANNMDSAREEPPPPAAADDDASEASPLRSDDGTTTTTSTRAASRRRRRALEEGE